MALPINFEVSDWQGDTHVEEGNDLFKDRRPLMFDGQTVYVGGYNTNHDELADIYDLSHEMPHGIWFPRGHTRAERVDGPNPTGWPAGHIEWIDGNIKPEWAAEIAKRLNAVSDDGQHGWDFSSEAPVSPSESTQVPTQPSTLGHTSEALRKALSASGHELGWQPGQNGKGYVDWDGKVHTWNVDDNGSPHHPEYMMGMQMNPLSDDFASGHAVTREATHPFTIGPDGYYSWVWDMQKDSPPPVHPSDVDPKLVPLFEEDQPGEWRFGSNDEWTVTESDFNPTNTFYPSGAGNPTRDDQRVVVANPFSREIVVGQPGTHHGDLIHHHGLDFEAISNMPQEERPYYEPVEDSPYTWTKDNAGDFNGLLHYGWINDRGGYGHVGPKYNGITEALHAHGLLQNPDGSMRYIESEEPWRFGGIENGDSREHVDPMSGPRPTALVHTVDIFQADPKDAEQWSKDGSAFRVGEHWYDAVDGDLLPDGSHDVQFGNDTAYLASIREPWQYPYEHGSDLDYDMWEAGGHGKGFIAPDGRVVTWNIGGYGRDPSEFYRNSGPHHSEVAGALGLPYNPDMKDEEKELDRQDYLEEGGDPADYVEPEQSWHSPFAITPEGEYVIPRQYNAWMQPHWKQDPHEILQQHGYVPHSNEESEWKFGAANGWTHQFHPDAVGTIEPDFITAGGIPILWDTNNQIVHFGAKDRYHADLYNHIMPPDYTVHDMKGYSQGRADLKDFTISAYDNVHPEAIQAAVDALNQRDGHGQWKQYQRPAEDEWLYSKTASYDTPPGLKPYVQGGPGKGMMMKDGTRYAWATDRFGDGNPTHAQAMSALGLFEGGVLDNGVESYMTAYEDGWGDWPPLDDFSKWKGDQTPEGEWKFADYEVEPRIIRVPAPPDLSGFNDYGNRAPIIHDSIGNVTYVGDKNTSHPQLFHYMEQHGMNPEDHAFDDAWRDNHDKGFHLGWIGYNPETFNEDHVQNGTFGWYGEKHPGAHVDRALSRELGIAPDSSLHDWHFGKTATDIHMFDEQVSGGAAENHGMTWRRPMLYDKHMDKAYIGALGDYHHDLLTQLGYKNVEDHDGRIKNYVQGWWNPESKDVSVWTDSTGFGANDADRVREGLLRQLHPNEEPAQEAQWNFSKTAMHVVPVDSTNGDAHGNEDGHPYIYDPASGKLYVGSNDSQHWDLIQNVSELQKHYDLSDRFNRPPKAEETNHQYGRIYRDPPSIMHLGPDVDDIHSHITQAINDYTGHDHHSESDAMWSFSKVAHNHVGLDPWPWMPFIDLDGKRLHPTDKNDEYGNPITYHAEVARQHGLNSNDLTIADFGRYTQDLEPKIIATPMGQNTLDNTRNRMDEESELWDGYYPEWKFANAPERTWGNAPVYPWMPFIDLDGHRYHPNQPTDEWGNVIDEPASLHAEVAAEHGLDLSDLERASFGRYDNKLEPKIIATPIGENGMNNTMQRVDIERELWDGYGPEGWDFKTAGISRGRRLEVLRQADAWHPDQSQIIHQFPDGWTVRQLTNRGDQAREGKLMHHCWAGVANTPEERAQEPHTTYGNNLLSLRDPDNWPHASWYHNPTTNVSTAVHGHGDSPAHPKYMERIHEWGQQTGADTTQADGWGTITPDQREEFRQRWQNVSTIPDISTTPVPSTFSHTAASLGPRCIMLADGQVITDADAFSHYKLCMKHGIDPRTVINYGYVSPISGKPQWFSNPDDVTRSIQNLQRNEPDAWDFTNAKGAASVASLPTVEMTWLDVVTGDVERDYPEHSDRVDTHRKKRTNMTREVDTHAGPQSPTNKHNPLSPLDPPPTQRDSGAYERGNMSELASFLTALSGSQTHRDNEEDQGTGSGIEHTQDAAERGLQRWDIDVDALPPITTHVKVDEHDARSYRELAQGYVSDNRPSHKRMVAVESIREASERLETGMGRLYHNPQDFDGEGKGLTLLDGRTLYWPTYGDEPHHAQVMEENGISPDDVDDYHYRNAGDVEWDQEDAPWSDLGWDHLGATQGWQPGSPGKGLYDPEANVLHTWNVDSMGDPHHYNMGYQDGHVPIDIDDEGMFAMQHGLGEYDEPWPEEYAQKIEKLHPGLTNDYDNDDWHWGKAGASFRPEYGEEERRRIEPWTPGQTGKAYVTNDGHVRAWATDEWGEPHHEQVADAYGEGYNGLRAIIPIIDEQGKVYEPINHRGEPQPEDHQLVIDAIGGSPVQNDWSFNRGPTGSRQANGGQIHFVNASLPSPENSEYWGDVNMSARPDTYEDTPYSFYHSPRENTLWYGNGWTHHRDIMNDYAIPDDAQMGWFHPNTGYYEYHGPQEYDEDISRAIADHFGQEFERPGDEWKFSNQDFIRHNSWEQGHPGKFFIDPDGYASAWKVNFDDDGDGRPYHIDMKHQLGYQRHEMYTPNGDWKPGWEHGWISPDGGVTALEGFDQEGIKRLADHIGGYNDSNARSDWKFANDGWSEQQVPPVADGTRDSGDWRKWVYGQGRGEIGQPGQYHSDLMPGVPWASDSSSGVINIRTGEYEVYGSGAHDDLNKDWKPADPRIHQWLTSQVPNAHQIEGYNWGFKFAGTPGEPFGQTPQVPVQQVNFEPDLRENSEWNGRMPIISDGKSVYYGPPNSTHAMLKLQVGRHDTQAQFAPYHGWIGFNPEQDWRPDAGQNPNFGWYGNPPGEHVNKAIMDHFGVDNEPEDDYSDWKFGSDRAWSVSDDYVPTKDEDSIMGAHEGDSFRYVILPNGRVHTWGDDEYPDFGTGGYGMHHFQYLNGLGVLNAAWSGDALPGQVRATDYANFNVPHLGWVQDNGKIQSTFGDRSEAAKILKRHIPWVQDSTDDDWHFSNIQHVHNWEPGRWGKGLIRPDGQIHTWPIDDNFYPHHMDYVAESIMGREHPDYAGATEGGGLQDISPWMNAAFVIAPDGEVQWSWGTQNHPDAIDLPGLKDKPNAPDWKFGAWDFGADSDFDENYDVVPEAWQPGHSGKGVFLQDGTPVVWKTDEDGFPGHGDRGTPPREMLDQGWATSFHVGPDGKAGFWYPTKIEPHHIDNLKNVGIHLDPEQQAGWRFGSNDDFIVPPGYYAPRFEDPEDNHKGLVMKDGTKYLWSLYGPMHDRTVHAEIMNQLGLDPHDVARYIDSQYPMINPWEFRRPDEQQFYMDNARRTSSQTWTPGKAGKGFFTPNGEMHTWNTGQFGDPHHAVYAYQNGIPWDGDNPLYPFRMDPDAGTYVDLHGMLTPEHKRIIEQSLGLKERPTGWTFGKTANIVELDSANEWSTEDPEGRRPVLAIGDKIFVGTPGTYHDNIRSTINPHNPDHRYDGTLEPAYGAVYADGTHRWYTPPSDQQRQMVAEYAGGAPVPDDWRFGSNNPYENFGGVHVHDSEAYPWRETDQAQWQSLPMIWNEDDDQLHIGKHDEVHHQDILDNLMVGSNRFQAPYHSKGALFHREPNQISYQWYEPVDDEKGLAKRLSEHFGQPVAKEQGDWVF